MNVCFLTSQRIRILRFLVKLQPLGVLLAILLLQRSVALGEELPPLFVEEQQTLDAANAEYESIFREITYRHEASSRDVVTCKEWQLLPEGLLWHSYLAGPQEPRISTVIYYDSEDGVFWDATLGGRVGLVRYGTAGAKNPSGWQWDLEGAVMTRLDLLHAEDVESMDYRFGTEITAAEGPWAAKFGYFHISSHVGDEYLVRNPTFKRLNYVTESLILGGSYKPIESIRLYGEFAYSFHTAGGAKPFQFQTGAEYTPFATSIWHGAPFAAVNLQFREAVDYDVSTTLQLGWSFLGPDSGHRLRFGAQYGDGPTSQFSFFQRRDRYIGLGVWFDY